MLTCTFENGNPASLRHVVVDAIAINDHNQILLVRRALHLTNPGKLSMPGGFLDRDEDVKQGVLRELQEETGYIGHIKWLLQINDSPTRKGEDRQSVAFVFIIHVTEKLTDPDQEVTDVSWYSLNDLPHESEFAFDHWETIQLYKRFKKDKFNIPLIGAYFEQPTK